MMITRHCVIFSSKCQRLPHAEPSNMHVVVRIPLHHARMQPNRTIKLEPAEEEARLVRNQCAIIQPLPFGFEDIHFNSFFIRMSPRPSSRKNDGQSFLTSRAETNYWWLTRTAIVIVAKWLLNASVELEGKMKWNVRRMKIVHQAS